ncbi:hypothetical protein JCGZ_15418 [Jatropha curcas]|uniref:Uncharacterized protein n=1 Tax=Jatropha curcas TaxID=180498 RepID=A0A067K904_JATCU|nr:hypothetical protein JCGZ_15418 [Jatropha curcas]
MYACNATTYAMYACNATTNIYECVQRVSMAPSAVRGWGAQSGGHASCGVGRRPVIVEETEESGSEDSEETESNMS